MSDPKTLCGSCLCGAVHLTATHVSNTMEACHCGMCRKWGGGPLLAVDCGTEVSFTGQDNISVFNSSDWAERGFCKKCGSHLFYRLKESQRYSLPAGLFDNDPSFVFDEQIFIDKKPSFYSFANETTNLTEAETFAKYAPPAK
ncbi:MAG: GFA family protein [Sedimenticola sp.]|nr:GFA family protein [Sedimenticola sp.]